MKVMVVDDHPVFRHGLVSLFDSQPDFEIVAEAGTAKDALTLAETVKSDLIIMDLGLPDGSGLDVMPKILQKSPEVMIVILTIHASDELAFTALRKGARGFLVKNIAASKLLAALRGLERGELAVSRTVLSRYVNEVLHFFSPHREEETSSRTNLTAREIEVLAELATGDDNQKIADRLYISENTLKVHVHNILHKLELTNRQEAAEYARRHGLAAKSL